MFESFITAFERIAKSLPDYSAIDDGDRSFSYRELNELSSGLAEKLLYSGVEKGDIVAVDCGRSCAHIISLIAIWKINAVFLPFDTSQAEERQKYILKDAGVDFVITDKKCSIDVKTVPFEYISRSFFNPAWISREDTSYIIYTSGSTGNPKGVKLNHSGLVIMLEDQIRAFELGPESKSLFCLSIYFDASLSDIGTALLSGSELVFAHPCQMNPDDLLSIMKERKITYVDIPPSLLRLIDPQKKPEFLRTIVIGGEVCDLKTVRCWSEKVTLVNVYGPTEATICTSLCVCTSNWKEPVLGQPMTGVTYRVSDEGELLISSQGLAEKYLNLPDLTDSKFITSEGVRYYRSGDKVEFRDGEYHFLGRLDRQVKLNGQLVEPEEVESAALKLDGVEEVAVFKYSTAGNREVLTAAYSGTVDKVFLRKSLESKLSSWLIPKRIVKLDSLPRNHANKIDVKKIKEKITQSCEGEDHLSSAVNTYFGYKIYSDADLFEEGLDSFGVMELSLNCSSLGIKLTPSLISEQRTVNKIRRALSKKASLTGVLKADAAKELSKVSFNKAAPERGKILLTGGTGFLGSKILNQLQSEGKQIICLVRGPANLKAATVCGDVSKERFGLNESEWNRLSEEIDEVIHCAAEVNNIKSYQELYPVNVEGTVEVLKFCNAGKAKFLHYCSTLSVFVSTDRNSGLLKESDRLENVKKVYGGYARSKFTAEKLLLEAQEVYPWINVMRFGLITGENSRSRDESLMMLIREIAKNGLIPADLDDSYSFDLTPVEKAALAFCRLAETESCGVFHIANEKSVSLKRLTELIAKKVNLEYVSFEKWQNSLQQNRMPEGVAVYLSLCRLWGIEAYEKFRTMDILQGTNVEFECRSIKKLGCAITEADDQCISRLIDSALELT